MSMIIDLNHHPFLEVRVSGSVNRVEADDIKHQLVAHAKAYGEFKVFVYLEEGFEQIDPHSDWSDDNQDEVIQDHVQQLAIVGDEKWRDSAMIFFLGGLLSFPIKFFNHAEQTLAWAWLGDPRHSEEVVAVPH